MLRGHAGAETSPQVRHNDAVNAGVSTQSMLMERPDGSYELHMLMDT